MQGTQIINSHVSLKSESVWFKTKLVSQFLVFSFLLSNPFYITYLQAAPAGGRVVSGTGSVDPSGLNINQTSQNMVVNWDSFNVDKTEIVNFNQPDATAIALNRINGNNGRSIINGQINANGHVILVNNSGVFFSSTATVNVGGIIASSLDIAPDDFMNGNYIFNEKAGGIGEFAGTVINHGLINASLGNVALIGNQVKNEGSKALITANLGSVALAAGKQAVLTFDNQGLIGVSVTKEVLQDEIGLEAAVVNSGEINASGGRVLLTASTSQDVFSQAVNNSAIEPATSVVVHEDGTFTLGGGADVINTGSIDVSSDSNSNNTARIVLLGENVTSSGNITADTDSGNAGEIELHANDTTLLTENSYTSAQAMKAGVGGVVKVLGDKVGLFDSSQVNVSGFNGGGQALFGGDYRGENKRLRNSTATYLAANASVFSDGKSTGNGGRIIFWGDEVVKAYGAINARGGAFGGDGGFVETSAKYVELYAQVDVSAPAGTGGTWLIDPNNIEIFNDVNGGTPPDTDGGDADNSCDTDNICDDNSVDITQTTNTTNNTETFTSSEAVSRLDSDILREALDSDGVTVIVETTAGIGAAEGALADGGGGNIWVSGDIDLEPTDLNNRDTDANRPTLELRAHHDIIIDGGIYDSQNNNDNLNIKLVANSNSATDAADGGDGGDIFINNRIRTNGGYFDASGNNIFIDYQNASFDTPAINTGNGYLKLTAINDGVITLTDSRIGTNNGILELRGGDLVTTSALAIRDIVTNDGNVNLYFSGNIDLQTAININGSGNLNVGFIHPSNSNLNIIPTSVTTSGNGSISLNGGDVSIHSMFKTGNVDPNDGGVSIGAAVTTQGGEFNIGFDNTIPANSVYATSFTNTAAGTISTDGGDVNLYVTPDAGNTASADNGDITLNGTIQTNGGVFTAGDNANSILPDSFVANASIDTSGTSNNNAGGNINIYSSGVITVNAIGELKANGQVDVSNGNPGAKGGDITLEAGNTITINSINAVSSLGSNGDRAGGSSPAQPGGEGGKVIISNTSGNIDITSSIVTQGGAAQGASGNINTGGTGGNVRLTATNGMVDVGNINTSGGNGDVTANNDGNGGLAGTITLESNSTVTLNNNLTAVGGTAGSNSGTQGAGNSIIINANTVLNNSVTVNASGITNGNINFNGVTSAVGDRVTDLTVTGNDITFAGDVGAINNRFKDIQITATGTVKAETSPAANDRKDFYSDTLNVIQSLNFTAQNIHANAADNFATNRIDADNTVIINSDNAINVGDVLTYGSTAAVASAGHSGGGINLSAQEITVGTLNTSGSNAETTSVDANGGDAGVISMIATDLADAGNAQITLNGNINASGGTATGAGTAGQSRDAGLQLVVDETAATPGVGTFTVNYTNDFSSKIIATGSAGVDTINGADRVNNWVITAANAGTLNKELPVTATSVPGIEFSSFEVIAGNNNTDTLSGRAVNNTWSVSGNGLGTLTNTDDSNEVIGFSMIDNLVGNTGNDNFTISATGSLSGSISDTGSTDTNSLSTQATTDITWDIDQVNGGTLTNTIIGNGFSNIHQIFSGGGDDTITVRAAGSIRDIIDGGGNRTTTGDSINLNELSTIDIVLGDSSAITASLTDLNINAIETIRGNNDGTNSTNTNSAKITGEDGRDNTWSLTGLNTGTVDSSSSNVRFIDFTDITGGNQNDTFTVSATGELKKGNTTALIDGQIDGGSHTLPLDETNSGDILNVASRANIQLNINSTTGNTLSFSGPSLSFTNIETVEGGGSNSTVVGENLDTSWDIFATDRGSVTSNSVTTYFRGFGNLTGGTANDAVTLRLDGTISGLINGGDHTAATTGDTVTISNPNAAVNIALGATANATANNITNIENIYANNLPNVTLIAEDLGTTTTTWNITGNNDGNLNSSWGTVNFTNIANLLGNSNVDEFYYTGLSDSGSGPGSGTWISGVVDGADGSDLIDMSGIGDNFTINLESDFINVEKIIGNAPDASRDTTLAGPVSSDLTPVTDVDWTVTGTNDGNVVFTDDQGVVNTVIFEDFRNILGQDNVDDTFAITTGNMLGTINGGAGSGTDSADYSLSSLTEIFVGGNFNGIDGVEQVIGNSNIQLTGLQGQDQSNSWRIYNDGSINNNGQNDGVVTYDRDTTTASNPIETLSFINFGKLKAGVNGEIFTIDQGGTFNGTIVGGAGADTVNLTLTGVEQGTLTFEAGSSTNDSIIIGGDNSALVGDGSGYTGIYAINADSTEGFSYTNQSNLFNIEYSGVESVTDNLIASSLTINGGSANDTITLNADNFHLLANVGLLTEHDATPVFYTNKNSLYVNGQGGLGDVIQIEDVQTFTNGTLSLNAETLTSTAASFPLITADELRIDSVTNTGTSLSKKINTNVTNLAVVNTGNLFITEQDGINITEYNNTNAVAQLDIVASAGDITSVDSVNPSIDINLVSNSTLSLTASDGNIFLNGDNQITGTINLSTPDTADIRLNNIRSIRLGDVSTRNLTITTSGTGSDILQQNNNTLTIDGLTRLSSTGDIRFVNSTNDFTTLSVDTAREVQISDSNTIGLNSVNGTSVDITVLDQITDANGDNPGDNVIADNLKLRAGTGIGNGNALETRVSNIDAITDSGQINIDNDRDVTLTNLVVRNDGNITFNNIGDVEIGKIDAGFGTRSPLQGGGDFTMTVTGGSVTGAPRADYRINPDIIAYNANILVPSGTFGTSARGISVQINNEFNLFSLQSAVVYIGQPLVDNDTSTAKIAITDAFSNLSGQQLIEVESIGDIDPAIFTDVRNYSHSDIALMMPSDQRYDIPDEEEEDQEAKEKRQKFLNSTP